MSRHISALLATTAAFYTCAAYAADLPVKKAVPIEFVRVCSAYGAGFFYIPGTDTCLRISGRARFEAGVVGSNYTRGSDLSNYRGAMRLNIDARTQTAYGTLRAFTRLDVQSRTGNFVTSGTQQRIANAFPALGPDTFGRAQQYVNVDKAFVQFAGLTAGRASSFFDFYAHDFEIMALTLGSDVASTNLLAYTAKFGEGWSATISLEDPTFRFQPIFAATSVAGTPNSSFNIFTASASLSPVANALNAAGIPTSGVYYDVTQKNRTPDFVGALRLDQAWGSAQLSAAVHEVGVGQPTGAIFGLNGGAPAAFAPVARASNEYGWAIQGGLKVNAPFIAPGDALYLQGAYGEGAMAYTGFQGYTATYIQSSTPVQNSPFVQYLNDAVVNPITGKIELSTSFTIVGSYLHYWSPEWRSALFGSYGEVSFSKSARAAVSLANPGGTASGLQSFAINPTAFALSPILRDNNQIVAGASLIWSPVKDLDIGAEGIYIRTALSQGRTYDVTKTTVNAAGVPIAGSPVVTVNHQDTYQIRARVQRDF
ncbi:porin [Methylobacterium planeticum]|uniref:Porin n=1 Tax=Methylobacterium planeticum TaxID=2615211 RepID=A0A6N6MJW7_9HYPH|nr:porin [Methylobacterium planeticum]KAB1070841.1 porin [Methylobacterium planeticum]